MMGSYLESILQYPSTCGDTSSSTGRLYVSAVASLILLALFTVGRAANRYHEAWRQFKERGRGCNKTTALYWAEGYHALAVVMAVASSILFIIAGTKGLGQHLCTLGLNEDLIAFTQGLITASQVNDKDADLMDYVNANSDKLDPVMVELLHTFLLKFKEAMLLLYSAFACYTLSLALQKFSNNYCILTMFGWNSPKLAILVRVHRWVTCAALAVTLGLGFFGTWPASASWDIAINRKWMRDPGWIHRGTAIANIALDLVVAPIPLKYFARMQKSASEKWILIGLFGSQWLAILFGIARIFMLGGLFGQDITYNSVIPLILTILQNTFYIIGESIPTLRKTIRSLKSRLRNAGTNKGFPTPPIIPEDFVQRVGHDSVQSDPYSQFDDCFVDDPDFGMEMKSALGSDVESTPSLSGPAAPVENVV